MIFMFDHCCKDHKSFIIIICYLHDFFHIFFHVILAQDELMAEVISFGIHRNFLNYISVPFKHLIMNFVD